MSFQSPIFLFFLLVLPYVIYIGWPRGGARKRQSFALVIRIMLLISLIMGLVQLSINQDNEQLAVLFLLDVSDSMSPAQQANAIDYIQDQIENKPSDDLAGVIVFGRNPLVEASLSKTPLFYEVHSVPLTGQTNIPAAIQLAQAIFPAESAKRIVLLSDGKNTQGDIVEAIEFSKALDIEVVPVEMPTNISAEALLLDVTSPARLQEGEKFDLTFTISSTETMTATIRIIADSAVIYEQSQPIDTGEHTYAIPLEANRTGIIDFNVQVIPEKDTFVQNNQKSSITMVSGPAKVLVVAIPEGTAQANGNMRPDEFTPLLNAFKNANILFDQIFPNQLPVEPALLAEYNAVVLVNIPARELLNAQMDTLQSYVRDLGGGVIAIGGPTSYGIGGYYRTPLEEMLPVEMLIKDDLRRASVTIVFVIDRSGSMADTSSGTSKLELAKEAAIRSIGLLLPFDKVGVVIFDENASWVVPIQEVSDGGSITEAIGTIRSGGGTDILAGIQAVNNLLPQDNAQAKHVILLTDGGADPTGIPELVEKLHDENGITLTSIGVGLDAAPFLINLAEIGGGRYHYVVNPETIPSIFTEETMLAARSYLIEEPFFPSLQSNSPILSGINEVPQLQGYVGTSPKATATTILVSDLGDPILASWQYGLGKAVAFTSDATGRWGRDWLAWDGFNSFWGQAISYVSANLESPSIDYQIIEQDGKYSLLVTNQQGSGIDLNGYELTATIISPSGETQQVMLEQTGSNRFEVPLGIETPGNYTFGVSGIDKTNGTQFVETFGWAQSYSPEYIPQNNLIPRILQITEPTVNRDNIFKHTISATASYKPIWQPLLAAAAILLIFDIAIRRLVFRKHDLLLFLKKIAPAPREEKIIPRNEQLNALKAAKKRATQNTDQAIAKDHAAPLASPTTKPTIIPAKAPEHETKGTEQKTTPAQQGSTAATLLQRKRNRKKNEEKDN